MKTVAIIQARLGSTRLPGKILLDIEGQSMIERVYNRLAMAEKIDQIVVATTTSKMDDRFAEYCQERGWECYRGSETDVLSRYVGACEAYAAERIIRVTSDCPLIDPGIVDELVFTSNLSQALEYTCNFFPQRRYPRGLDCEVLTVKALNRINNLANQPEHREHGTLYAYRNPGQFCTGSVTCSGDYSDLRWTVDTEHDLSLVRQIYQYFSNRPDGHFDWKDVIAAYKFNSHWKEINQFVAQKVA